MSHCNHGVRLLDLHANTFSKRYKRKFHLNVKVHKDKISYQYNLSYHCRIHRKIRYRSKSRVYVQIRIKRYAIQNNFPFGNGKKR